MKSIIKSISSIIIVVTLMTTNIFGNKENINLKNMKIDLKNRQVIKSSEKNTRIDKSGIKIEQYIVECKDLEILRNKCGIEVNEKKLIRILK